MVRGVNAATALCCKPASGERGLTLKEVGRRHARGLLDRDVGGGARRIRLLDHQRPRCPLHAGQQVHQAVEAIRPVFNAWERGTVAMRQ